MLCVMASHEKQMTLEEVRSRIDRSKGEHPRLLATREEFQRLRESRKSNPLVEATAQAIIRQADAMLAASRSSANCKAVVCWASRDAA